MSTPTVLAAYGTRNGSTAGIADMIVLALHAEGIHAEAGPARQAHEVTRYGAVVLGGALYSGQWHGDARRFARPAWTRTIAVQLLTDSRMRR